MRRFLILILSVFILASCTTTRWVVTDQYAVDESATPQIANEERVFVLDKEPSVEDPVAGFSLYEIKDLEYPKKVRVERSVQKYRPKWGFVVLGLAGAGIAAVAANTDVVFTSSSTSQKLGLNLAAGIISVLSFANMEAVGDPIYTGETKLMRRSGVEVRTDSIRVESEVDSLFADVSVHHDGKLLFEQEDVPLEGSTLNLNLASFAEELNGSARGETELSIELNYEGEISRYSIPVSQFLAPYLNVTTIIANLRSSPERTDINLVSEVGRGSFLEILGEEDDHWYRVLFEDEAVFVEKESGEVEWMSTVDSGPALVFEYAELPFGEIDVEHSMPVLKQHNADDRALVISNGLNNDVGQRQYLNRDHQLFETYMTTSLQLRDNQVREVVEQNLLNELVGISAMDREGSLYVYLSGFAQITDSNGDLSIVMVTEREDQTTKISLNRIFRELVRINPESLFLFTDLQYVGQPASESDGFNRNGEIALLQQSANIILQDLPNSAIVFSNKPGQQSAIYSGLLDGNKRHSVFNYYWAEAIQQRQTRISDLVRHLERNIDYTSRRLHDQPQEIQAFGNLTLNITRQ